MPPPVQPVQGPGDPSRVEEFLTRQLEVLADIRYALQHPPAGVAGGARPAAPGPAAGPAAAAGLFATTAGLSQAFAGLAATTAALNQAMKAAAAPGGTTRVSAPAPGTPPAPPPFLRPGTYPAANLVPAPNVQPAVPPGGPPVQPWARPGVYPTAALAPTPAPGAPAPPFVASALAPTRATPRPAGVGTRLESAAESIGGLGRAFIALTGTTVGLNQAMKAVALASPNTMATFQGNVDLLQARIGTVLVPIVERLSGALEKWADRIEGLRGAPGSLQEQALDYAGRVLARPGAAVEPMVQGLNALLRLTTGQGYQESLKKVPAWLQAILPAPSEQEKWSKRRSGAGLVQPELLGSPVDYINRMQMAVLGQDEQQAELMREQLKNLQDLNALLDKVVDNTKDLKDMKPAFR